MTETPNRTKPKVALIAGPTASGKSVLAMMLAERHDGVVINADSAQIYRDLRVLSARPSPADEARVPHRLFGHVDGAELYSAARWASEAKATIDRVVSEGGLPILVGGTGLYIRTLLDGIAPVPDIDPHIRVEVRAMQVAKAHAMLATLDPAAATRLAPADTTRVARALEVVRSTGRTLADWQQHRVGGIAGEIALTATILLPPRDWLLARCDARLDAMFAGGAEDEVRALLDRPDIAAVAPVRRAIGVGEIAAYLSGTISRPAAISAAQIATRRYAKRQYTWFRHQPPEAWSQIDETDAGQMLAHVETLLLDCQLTRIFPAISGPAPTLLLGGDQGDTT